jgi:hypothetical protein
VASFKSCDGSHVLHSSEFQAAANKEEGEAI